jgi:hypothetical protein
MCRYKSEGDPNGRSDCDSLREQNEMNHNLICKLRAEIARLREENETLRDHWPTFWKPLPVAVKEAT